MRHRAGMRGLWVGLVLSGVAIMAARADESVTWNFDVSTTGQPVHWVTQTALDPAASLYDMNWEIQQILVTVRYSFFTYTVDVTDQVPPEQLMGAETVFGPPPVVVADQDVVYPLPPETPGLQAHVTMGLQADGRGYVDLTNIVFGYIQVEIPGYGYVTVQVRGIRAVGVMNGHTHFLHPGDLNCDGEVDFDDIDPFVLALGGRDGYDAAFPDCTWFDADITGDQTVTFDDIDPFVALLGTR